MSMYGDGNNTKNYLYDELCDFANDRGIEEVVEIFSDVLQSYFFDFKERKEAEIQEAIAEATKKLQNDYISYKEKYEEICKVVNK